MALTTEEVKLKVTATGIENFDKISKGADQAKNKVNSLMSALAGISFGALIQQSLQLASAIDGLSKSTGISTQTILGFQKAMSASGANAERARGAISDLTKNIGEAAAGSDELRKAFAKAGVGMNELRNMSEEDILKTVIAGLAKIPDGATRSATAMKLMSDNIKGVDIQSVANGLAQFTNEAKSSADAIKTAAEQQALLTQSFQNLQIGALQALEPIFELLGNKKLGIPEAKKLVEIMGVSLAVLFGAKVIAGAVDFVKAILDLNKALKINVALQAGLQALQGPKGWAVLAGAAATAAGAIYGINKLIDETDTKAKDAAESVKKMLLPDTGAGAGRGSANDPRRVDLGPQRKIEKSPQQLAKEKAQQASELAIQKSLLEAQFYQSKKTNDDIANITLQSDLEIAKAKKDIFAKELLEQADKEKEFAAKKKEIQSKADSEIAQLRADAQQEALNKVTSLQQQTAELESNLALQTKIRDMTAIDADKAKKINDIEQEHKRQLYEIKQIKNLPEPDRLKREQQINEEYKKRIGLIEDEATAKLNYEQNFAAGVKRAFQEYEQSMTPLKQGEKMAASVFNNMERYLDNFVETGKFNFADFSRSVIQELLKIELKAAAVQMISAAKSSIFSFLGFANGAAFNGGRVTAFANGGVVGGPTLFPMANGMGLMGEAGPEAVMPLKRTASGKLGVAAEGAGGGQTINNYNYSISAVDAKSVAQLFAENRMTMLGTVRQAEKELPFRGR